MMPLHCTGFIGGTVVSRLLAHPEAKSFELTALVRSSDKAAKLNSLGIKTVLGSYDDLEILTRAASEADIVFAMADSDNLPAATALLNGLKRKFEATGNAAILIHTSGSAIVMDDARGLHGDHIIYSDLQSDEIEALPETAFHRNVDIELVKAGKEGYVKVYIVTPGTVFGPTSGPLVDLGVQNQHSIQIPTLVKASVARKQGGFIGAGKNIWPAVSVQDSEYPKDVTSSLFIHLFDAARKNPDSIGHGRDGFYFVENFEYSGFELAKITGEELAQLGIANSPEPTPFTEDELVKSIGNFWPFLATNSRVRGDRSRALGWKPVDGRDAFVKDVKAEVGRLANA